MSALVLTGKRQMTVESTSRPQPSDDEVLIEVSAAGICGSELGGFLGTNALRTPPLVMGHEASGRISVESLEPLGDGSTARVGKLVTFNPLLTCGVCAFCRDARTNLCSERRIVGIHCPGAFAEVVSVPARQCWSLPESLDAATAVMVEPMACAVRAVKRALLRESSTVVVLGAGPIGLCTLLAAQEKVQSRLVVVEPSKRRRELAKDWGATDWLEPGSEIEREFDVVIDAVGSAESRVEAFERVKPGGRIVVLGLHDEQSVLPVAGLVRDEIEMLGSFAYVQEDFAGAIELLHKALPLPADDWLEVRSLNDGQAAFTELVSGDFEKAKIALVP